MNEKEARQRAAADAKEREMWTRIGALRNVAAELRAGAKAAAVEARAMRTEADAPRIADLERKLSVAVEANKTLKKERDAAVARLTALREAINFVPPKESA